MKKKILSVLLALTMVVTGIYVTQPMANEAWAADAQQISDEITPDAADEGMLDIKMQTSEVYDFNGKEAVDLRVVSSVNGLGYSYVGFNLWYGTDITIDKETGAVSLSEKPTATYKTKSVAERINAEEYKYSPKVVDTSSEYFVTATIEGILVDNFNKNFYIEAYCVPLAGAESTDPIPGTGKLFNIEQAKETINIAVPQGTLSGTTIENVTVGGAKATATLAGYYNGYAHLYVTVDGGKTSLPSASKIVVGGDGSASYAIYRNLETDYTGYNADTSWYTVYEAEGEDEFVIATDADLYGFAKAETNFAGKTIYMVADIDANIGRATTDGWLNTDAEGAKIEGYTSYPWSPIGTHNNTERTFAGTFDGQMHTIKGIYFDKAATVNGVWGLFGRTADCTIQNFTLANSYMGIDTTTYTNKVQLGAIAGLSAGKIDTVKVAENVYMKHVFGSATGGKTGGIVGYITGTSGKMTISNCWFAGEITAGENLGGIVGEVSNAYDMTLQNCLYSGKIHLNKASGIVGGLCGQVYKSKMGIEDCLIAGALDLTTYEVTTGNRGAVIGYGAGLYSGESFVATVNKTYALLDTNWNRYISTGSAKFNVDGNETSGSVVQVAVDLNRFVSKAFCTGEAGYVNMNLDFTIGDDYTGYWSTTATGTPVLSSFVNTEDVLELDKVTTARTVWYNEAASDATEYTLYSMADMFGFASLTDETFVGKTVKLGADITMNKGTADATGFVQDTEEQTTLIPWTPRDMAGTFDGDGHAIRGVYMNTNKGNAGLFASVTGTVQNLRLLNSYIKCTDSTAQHYEDTDFLYGVGSIAGSLSGTMDTVYSDAIIDYTNAYAGGLVGTVYGTGANVITNSCFAGQISARNGVGGIVGLVSNTTATIEHCLNTGRVITTNILVGGLCGYVWTKDSDVSAKLYLTDSLNAKNVEAPDDTWRGEGIGWVKAATAEVSNTYWLFTATGQKFVGNGGNLVTLLDATGTENSQTYHYRTLDAIIDKSNIDLSFQTEGADNTDNYWVAREGKIPMLASFEDLLKNVTY